MLNTEQPVNPTSPNFSTNSINPLLINCPPPLQNYPEPDSQHPLPFPQGFIPENCPTFRKIELPTSDGTDVFGWLAQAEHFFDIMRIPMETKVSVIFLGMFGSALPWFWLLKRQNPQIQWADFKTELISRFGGGSTANYFERLAALTQTSTVSSFIEQFEALLAQPALTQTSTVSSFIEQFEALLAQLPALSDEQCLGYFFNGLQSNIRRWVKTFSPPNFSAALKLAIRIEDELLSGTHKDTNLYKSVHST